MANEREYDLHGWTRQQTRAFLNAAWASREWHGLTRVRIIHGNGAALWQEVRQWCEEKGIQWANDPRNPGVTTIHPAIRLTTPVSPPHRPLSQLRRRVGTPRTPRPPDPPPAGPESAGGPPRPRMGGRAPIPRGARPGQPGEDDRRLLDEEMDRLAAEDPRETRRRKQQRG